MTQDDFGIITERRADRERYGRYQYRAPVIMTGDRQSVLETPEAQSAIAHRKQVIFDELVEQEARKLAKSSFDEWKSSRLPPIPMLFQMASEITGTSIALIRGASRSRPNVYPRHFAVWLIRKARPDMSLPKIGKLFGNRDHTSMMHALSNVIKFAEVEEKPFKGWLADERTRNIVAGQ